MAKTHQSLEVLTDKKSHNHAGPTSITNQGSNMLGTAYLPVTANSAIEEIDLESQISRLNDNRWLTGQRRVLAQQIGKVQGNHYLQRLIASTQVRRKLSKEKALSVNKPGVKMPPYNYCEFPLQRQNVGEEKTATQEPASSKWGQYLKESAKNPNAKNVKHGKIDWMTMEPGAYEYIPLEGTKLEQNLILFVNIIEDDISKWEKFRTTFVLPVPGEQSAIASEKMRDYLQNVAILEFGVPDESYLIRSVTRYLRQKLGPTKLYLLNELDSFGITTIKTGASEHLEKLLNIQPIHPVHNYTLRVKSTKAIGVPTGVKLQGVQREMTVEYKDQIGLKYFKNLTSTSVRSGIGKGGKWVFQSSGATIGYARSVEQYKFWAPDDFTGFMMAKKIGMTVGGVSGGGVEIGYECKLSETITFFNAGKGDSISFSMTTPGTCKISSPKVTPEEVPQPGTPIKPELKPPKAGIDVEAGWAVGGEVKGVTPKIPPPRSGKPRAVPLMSMKVYFDTGKSILKAEELRRVEAIIEAVSIFNQNYPNKDIIFELVGHSSLSWRHLKRKQTAESLNQALSGKRVHKTLEWIQGRFRPQGPGKCAFETQALAGKTNTANDIRSMLAFIDARGSREHKKAAEEAQKIIDSGKPLTNDEYRNLLDIVQILDLEEFRRVDIQIYTTEQTLEPGLLPGKGKR